MQHVVVVVPHERELEAVFGGIERDGLRARRAIETVDSLALYPCEVHGVVERTDDAMITATDTVERAPQEQYAVGVPLWQTVLDVIKRRVDEHPRIVPGTRLYANRFVDKGVLREVAVRDGDGCSVNMS